MYELRYSESFQKSLEATISYWQQKIELSDDKISEFVSSIYKSTEALKRYPYLAENVATKYGFNQPTYRVVIGKSYAFFYRVNQKKVEIGSLYNTKQMKVSF
ncbi:MAG: type II toxin-antitoxin system RelE/ParE family toxin [Liquorilactobacillus nagelii]|uniref:type II toxin-antitoxin system RelE/ParE family toxin n=1 Tax=Liquorilactobacillus nagelii TaxID=82688 RepID=UPI0039EADBCF